MPKFYYIDVMPCSITEGIQYDDPVDFPEEKDPDEAYDEQRQREVDAS